MLNVEYSDVELRILGHLRAVGSRNYEQEERKRNLKETALTLVLVAVVGLIGYWSIT